MLGMSKSFVIVLVLSGIIGYEFGWGAFFALIVIYAVIKMIWRFLT